jgi:tripartite-type tricarboxylate transporter receptor subunit TctC
MTWGKKWPCFNGSSYRGEKILKLLKSLFFIFLTFFVCNFVGAQSYPLKPVRVIVPFPTGGTTDLVTRIVAQQLSELWGQQVIVENKIGAAGNVGAEAVAHARADGYTLLLAGISFSVNPSLYKNMPYDVTKDFVPVTQVAMTPSVLVTHLSVPANSMKEFIAFAKTHPGELNFGSAGSGGSTHLGPALLESMAGIKMTHIPYRGVAESYIDLIAGRVQLMIDSQPTAMPHIKAGKVRALAVTSLKRALALPDLPTLSESGVSGYDMTGWYGAFAPAGIAPEIAKKLTTDFVSVIKKPSVSASLMTQGAEPVASNAEQFSRFLQIELKKWADVIKNTGIIAD